jgi:hypothetical protein
MIDYSNPLDIEEVVGNDRFFSYMNNSFTKTKDVEDYIS